MVQASNLTIKEKWFLSGRRSGHDEESSSEGTRLLLELGCGSRWDQPWRLSYPCQGMNDWLAVDTPPLVILEKRILSCVGELNYWPPGC
jgi:hypothetical protein